MKKTIKKTRNTLSCDNRAWLTVWMSQNESVVAENTDAEVAKIASEKLGFTIAKFSVASIRGALFPHLDRRRNPSTILPAMFAAMRQELDALGVRISLLETQPAPARSAKRK